MGKSLIALALVLLLFSVSAHALYVKVPSTIIVQQGQKDVPIAIRNDGELEQSYGIRFHSPLDIVISPSSGSLGGGKSAIASLSITPKEGLEGSAYEGIVEVQLGEEKAFRNIRVIFKEGEKETGPGQETAAAGFFSLADFSAFVSALFTPENMLNTFLAIVAAVLLIAFIARFVKRLEARK